MVSNQILRNQNKNFNSAFTLAKSTSKKTIYAIQETIYIHKYIFMHGKDLKTPMVHEEVIEDKELVSSHIHLVSLHNLNYKLKFTNLNFKLYPATHIS